MRTRSWLQVGAGEDLSAAMSTGADALIVDLAAIAQDEHHDALAQTGEWLAAHRTNVLEARAVSRWVRIHALDSGARWRDDLLAVIPSAPDGIVLPRANTPEVVRQLAAEMYEIEQQSGIEANSIRILPIVGETAAAALAIPQFAENGHQRLIGLAWQSEGLARELDTARLLDANGDWSGAFAQVRMQTLLAAKAAGLVAIDAPPPGTALETRVSNSRADGFDGMLVTEAALVSPVNTAFDTRPGVRQSDEQDDGDPADSLLAGLTVGGKRKFDGERREPAAILRPA